MRKSESVKDRFENFTNSFNRTLAKVKFHPAKDNLLKTVWTDTKSAILGFSFTMIAVLAFTNFGNKNTPATTLPINSNIILSFPKKEFTDQRDQQKYPMLKINNRWWMGKNLNFKTANSSCYNNQNECSELGMLYTWDDAKTACPKNWRLPTEEEWSSMLRSSFGRNQSCLNCYASLIENGISGFEGKLGGFKSSNGSSYFAKNNYAYYWTSSPTDSLNAEYFVFSKPKRFVNKSTGLKNSGFSCRCILEEGKEPSDTSSTTIAPSPQSTELEITAPSPQPTKPKITAPSAQPTKTETTAPSPQPTKTKITAPSSQPIKTETTAPSPQPTKPLFKTGSFADERNNQTYPTVRINGKWWMAENLNYPTKGSFYYNDEIEKYGALYTWKSAQRACPKGWHLPSDDEWLDMTRYIGKNFVTQEEITSNDETKNQNVTVFDYLIVGGESQFNAVFGGLREKGRKGKFSSIDVLGYYWSSTQKDKKEAWLYGFSNLQEKNKLTRSNQNKDWGLSCRCVRN